MKLLRHIFYVLLYAAAVAIGSFWFFYAFFAPVRVHGSTFVTIDCGSAADQYFTGGNLYTIDPPPASSDATLRFGTFRYNLPVTDELPYVVTFTFVEPTIKTRAGRIFSVAINNQTVIDRLDLFAEAGFQIPLKRSVIVMPAAGMLNISFVASVRSAVVSSIQAIPLTDRFTGDPKVAWFLWYELIAARQPDGTYLYSAVTIPKGPTVVQGPLVFRNGQRQSSDSAVPDFSIDPAQPEHIIPNPSLPPWSALDMVIIEFWGTINGGPTISNKVLKSN